MRTAKYLNLPFIFPHAFPGTGYYRIVFEYEIRFPNGMTRLSTDFYPSGNTSHMTDIEVFEWHAFDIWEGLESPEPWPGNYIEHFLRNRREPRLPDFRPLNTRIAR